MGFPENCSKGKPSGSRRRVLEGGSAEGFFPSSTPFLLSLPPIIESGWKKWKSRKEKIGKNREIGFPKIQSSKRCYRLKLIHIGWRNPCSLGFNLQRKEDYKVGNGCPRVLYPTNYTLGHLSSKFIDLRNGGQSPGVVDRYPQRDEIV